MLPRLFHKQPFPPAAFSIFTPQLFSSHFIPLQGSQSSHSRQALQGPLTSRSRKHKTLRVSPASRPWISRISRTVLVGPNQLTATVSNMSMEPPPSPSIRRLVGLVEFYDPVAKGEDEHGRTLDEILSWTDSQLERQHDFIQTLFPLPENSGFNSTAPIVDEETMIKFHQSRALRSNVLRALRRMLVLYGFDSQIKEGTHWRLLIAPMDCIGNPFVRWLKPSTHNHLRITRIIRSLRILGLPGVAWDMYRAFMAIHKTEIIVGATTIGFWSRALRAPVHQAPDGTDVDWLRRYSLECPIIGPLCSYEMMYPKPEDFA
ncbi:opioid growth factor receptor conserved region-domain-containing protein [Nemania sp. NC0429]|nr:opioid growth factor receptor conserved region-domain-containing protein [Nemania sp. NC0429]